VLSINDDPNSPFPHRPEPKPETMAQLSAIVKAGNADIGFAHDADGERLGIVDERGEPLSEELTFALATRIRLAEKSAGL
jgi:phosphomannomutase